MGAVLVNEDQERLVKGDKGERGAEGKQGERGLGLSRPLRLALVFLFVLSLAVGSAAYLAAIRYYHDSQASQQRQGAVIEQRLCTTLERLAALKPPAGNPAANPARAFDQEQQALLARLGPDVGCRR
jgi:hypothetical protein